MKIVRRPQLKIDQELIDICIKIRAENRTDHEWSEVESSDMYQSSSYCGGYDAIEEAFWFTYYAPENKEWWFEITTAILDNVISGRLQYVDLYEPN